MGLLNNAAGKPGTQPGEQAGAQPAGQAGARGEGQADVQADGQTGVQGDGQTDARVSGQAGAQPASPNAEQIAGRIAQQLLNRLPGARAWLQANAHKTLLEAVGRGGAGMISPDLAAALQTKTAALLGPDVARALARRLAKDNSVLAANHHGINTHPEFMQAALFFALPELFPNGPQGPAQIAGQAAGQIAGQTAGQASAVPVLACSSVSMRSYSFPRGLLLGRPGGGYPWMRLPLFPATFSDVCVGSAPALTREHCRAAVRNWAKLDLRPQEFAAARQIVQEHIETDAVLNCTRFSDQATLINASLWQACLSGSGKPGELGGLGEPGGPGGAGKPGEPAGLVKPGAQRGVGGLGEQAGHGEAGGLTGLVKPGGQTWQGRQAPPLVFLDLEDVAVELLKLELARPASLFWHILCRPKTRQAVYHAMVGIPGCWNPQEARLAEDSEVKGGGTTFFWHMDAKGRRHALRPKDSSLNCLHGGERDFPMESAALLEGLSSGSLRPGLFCSYLVLLAHGMAFQGGIYMVDYLPAMLGRLHACFDSGNKGGNAGCADNGLPGARPDALAKAPSTLPPANTSRANAPASTTPSATGPASTTSSVTGPATAVPLATGLISIGPAATTPQSPYSENSLLPGLLPDALLPDLSSDALLHNVPSDAQSLALSPDELLPDTLPPALPPDAQSPNVPPDAQSPNVPPDAQSPNVPPDALSPAAPPAAPLQNIPPKNLPPLSAGQAELGSVFMPFCQYIDDEAHPAGLLELLPQANRLPGLLKQFAALRVKDAAPASLAAWYTECVPPEERLQDWPNGVRELRRQSVSLPLPLPMNE